ncbi:hypothetical protein NDU88_005299 [Pleurodeles waltl]|uniref:Uncharacterized protein n=1 Tax=Pleurodeles waltl TaxID=8319 RepID=A0AAV7WX81_PLEWA|nr:hypothetical protein NDU88_005299 [Pleurodeles waltl]
MVPVSRMVQTADCRWRDDAQEHSVERLSRPAEELLDSWDTPGASSKERMGNRGHFCACRNARSIADEFVMSLASDGTGQHN